MICGLCDRQAIENEFHILTQYSFYIDERLELFTKIANSYFKFPDLNHIDKAKWFLVQEDKEILFALG